MLALIEDDVRLIVAMIKVARAHAYVNVLAVYGHHQAVRCNTSASLSSAICLQVVKSVEWSANVKSSSLPSVLLVCGSITSL